MQIVSLSLFILCGKRTPLAHGTKQRNDLITYSEKGGQREGEVQCKHVQSHTRFHVGRIIKCNLPHVCMNAHMLQQHDNLVTIPSILIIFSLST